MPSLLPTTALPRCACDLKRNIYMYTYNHDDDVKPMDAVEPWVESDEDHTINMFMFTFSGTSYTGCIFMIIFFWLPQNQILHIWSSFMNIMKNNMEKFLYSSVIGGNCGSCEVKYKILRFDSIQRIFSSLDWQMREVYLHLYDEYYFNWKFFAEYWHSFLTPQSVISIVELGVRRSC